MLWHKVLNWVITRNFPIRFLADHAVAPSFPFLAFPSPLPREEIQTSSGLLHMEFCNYFLLFHELLPLSTILRAIQRREGCCGARC